MSNEDVCVVVGVGPGNGESFCRKFAREGYRVAALARNEDKLDDEVGDLDGVTPYRQDATDPDQVGRVYDEIGDELGEPRVVLYNAGSGAFGSFDEVDAEDLRSAWEVNTLGLFHTAKAVLPTMRSRGSGVLGITGATATTRGKPFTTAFAQAKAAQHHLAESLAREFGPAGVHVFYFIVDGVIDLPRTREAMPDKGDEFFLKPDDIAHSVYEVAHQPKSAWTFEFDLRPYCEDW
ncbi:MAG: SDR family NAD(P)-dependent oxidoreductase [Persicimonas sp.]